MVLDESSMVKYEDLTEEETNTLVRSLITNGVPPVRLCCGRKEWFEEHYDLQLTNFRKKEIEK